MLDLTTELTRLNKLYREADQDTLNILLMGDLGTGKTHIVGKTARRPVYIYSFDPGGTKHLKQEIADGHVFVDLFESLTRTWTDFALDLQKKSQEENFFAPFGTVCIDGLTGMADRLMRSVAQAKSRTDQQILQSDYKIVAAKIIEVINMVCHLPCDTVFTAHITEDRDESGKKEGTILMPGKGARVIIPTLFDEVYVASTTKNGKGEVEYRLQTANDGTYKARTRAGTGKFNLHEVADIMALRKKAGWGCEHKEKLNV